VAGAHFSRVSDSGGNLAALAAAGVEGKATVLRIARWDEGIAYARGLTLRSARAAVSGKLQWVGREPGSGARRCLDELLAGRAPPRRQARDHRGVAEAIRNGWADAGVCVRLAGEEAQLGFLTVWKEDYDLCFPAALANDPRLQGLVEVVRSRTYGRLLEDLPGYDTKETGELRHVSLGSE
jgi:molybdate-binding protein